MKKLMKKLLLMVSVVAIAGAPMANAFDLEINGQPIEGVSGSSFTFSDGVLSLTLPSPTPDGVEVGKSIPDSAMARIGRFDKRIWVPANKGILAQSFTTIDSLTSYGNFIYHIVAGDLYTPPLNFWVSLSPGGEAISPQCYYPRGRDVSTLVWTHFSSNRCVLEPSTSYYLNVQHDEEGPRSRIDRWVRVLKL